MPARTRTPDFAALNITLAAGGTIATALTEHRVLVSLLDNWFFIIANTTDRAAALAQANQIDKVMEGYRGVYTILLTDEHLAALTDGVDNLKVAVLPTGRRPNPAPTPIKVSNRSGINVRTAYGTAHSTVVTSRDLHAGDLYTLGVPTFNIPGPGADWTLYRALADYDPATGRVEHHIVTPDWEPGDYHGALTDGPDNVVFRVDDPNGFFLARYPLAAVPANA